ARPSLTAGTRVGWAAGAAGLIYFVHLPALLFLWLYRVSGVRPAGGTATSGSVAGAPTPLRGLGVVAVATVVCLAIVSGWERYAAALLGLNFSGGNNDYAAEAVKNWLGVAGQGPVAVLNQLHLASLRGILVGAFYYPWWLLAALGVATSPREARRWAVAVLLAAAVPAIAFSIRFQLPRLAYFMYPAVYLLAAQGIEVMASRLAGRPGRRTWLVAALLVLALAAVSNADLTGWQQLNVWFHYAQGNTW
ncbi:MAG TPA: hypothetical protein VHS99_23860, partial [Chloroflexota bacterium]|nr:hypothetical protein [Chloroflexota bacterium]